MVVWDSGNSPATLPEINSSHLKMDGWKTSFLLGRPIFSCQLLVSGGVFQDLFRLVNSSTSPRILKKEGRKNMGMRTPFEPNGKKPALLFIILVVSEILKLHFCRVPKNDRRTPKNYRLVELLEDVFFHTRVIFRLRLRGQ